MSKDLYLEGTKNHDSYDDALTASKVKFEDTIIVDELEEAHRIPSELADLPFIDLAMFLHYQIDGVSPGELTPQMLSAWIETHKKYCEEKKRITLQYQVLPIFDLMRVQELMVDWAGRHIEEQDEKFNVEPFIKAKAMINIDKGLRNKK
jgi:hypothetical protein